MSSFTTNNVIGGSLYSAPLIPHAQMVWWYMDLHDNVEKAASLIGEKTSFLDHFIIDTAMRCGASLLRNRTIFVDDDAVKKMGGKSQKIQAGKSYLPRETLMLNISIDFLYHEAARPEDINPPFYQHRDRIPFVHAVYIILAESFLRTVSNYCSYIEQICHLRLEIEENPRPNRVIQLSRLEISASSLEKKLRGDRATLYGVVKQIRWHMTFVEHMKNRVITAFRRLAMQVAKKYGRSEQQINDNFQHGSTGLIRAANYFDPYREKAFSGLARNWIQASVLLHLKTEANMCKIPAPVWQLFRKIEQVAHDNSIEGDYPAIAKKMKMETIEVMEVYRMIQINRPISLENPVSEDESNNTTLKDNIEDESKSPEDVLVESSDRLSDYMKGLGYQERMVICCLFGTYEEIPQKDTILSDHDIESERLRQIAIKARRDAA